ncbi:unnamed protein product [Caenorhabditis angaria]|uniref:RING-type domain-containing protein n=1 Tax=Caenorhabditis angaria TaxID=860376 RepID=A0A9P1MZD0_9PELO|nr:unnamed protein product [Caenorhabditis angaria]
MKSNSNIPYLIPSYLEKMKMYSKVAEIRVMYDAPTKQTTYTYQLNWNCDANQREACIKSLEKGNHIGKQATVPRSKKDSEYPVIAVCDGPCENAYPSNKLNILGRCGHYLCDKCYEIVKNSDGTRGCSSYACNWEKSLEFEETEDKKTQTSEIKNLSDESIPSISKLIIDMDDESNYTCSILSTDSKTTVTLDRR